MVTQSQRLQSGQWLSRKEYHVIYEQMPEDFRAELVGGIVYVETRTKVQHGANCVLFGVALLTYENATLGTESSSCTTVLLDEFNEPEPDLLLRICPEFGGQSTTTADDYLQGPPELIVEVSVSSQSIDFGAKHREYVAAGLKEYLVLNLQDRRLHWFDLTSDRELSPEADGVYRIRTFPGLWIDSTALLARDLRRLLTVLDIGLATPEHAAFVTQLAAAKKP